MKRLYQAPQDNENLIRYFGKVKRANGGYGGTFISSTDLSRFAMELVTLLEKNSDIF